MYYDVSIAVGELALLPAVRKAPAGTLIVADGFSCREQIAQATTRRAVHLAEALRDALHPRRSSERALTEKRGPRELAAACLFGIGVALGLFAVRRMRHV
jgi:hypothetical protein